MPDFRIYCDFDFGPEARQLLEEGLRPSQLLVPAPQASPGKSDELLLEADIAFGQPDFARALASKRVRWIQLTSAGYTRYDTAEVRAAAKSSGIEITNSSSVFAEPCAEHVLAFMLAQTRALLPAVADRDHARFLAPGSGTTLLGREVVILGYGAIAARLVEMLAPFQARITGMRRAPTGDEGVAMVTPQELRGPLASADHVVNILPDNADSRHFVSDEFLRAMKRGAVLYNIGRGATVDQAALASHLESDHLAAAWLDVTDPEPLPDGHPLRALPNCHITPHVAGRHLDEETNLVRHFLQNFRRFSEGTPLTDRVM